MEFTEEVYLEEMKSIVGEEQALYVYYNDSEKFSEMFEEWKFEMSRKEKNSSKKKKKISKMGM